MEFISVVFFADFETFVHEASGYVLENLSNRRLPKLANWNHHLISVFLSAKSTVEPEIFEYENQLHLHISKIIVLK